MINDSIEQIAARNCTKELDKAWEQSLVRKVVIALVTYTSALTFLWIIKVSEPYLTALIPVGGFSLSTATLPPIKR